MPSPAPTAQAELDASFLRCAAGNQSRAVARMIERGARLDAVDSSGRTALNLATRNDGLATCQALLAAAPGLARIADRDGETPLMISAWRGEQRSALLLLPHSDPAARDKNGLCAMLHCFHAKSIMASSAAKGWAVAELIEESLLASGREPEAFMQLSALHGMLSGMDHDELPANLLERRDALGAKLDAWRERWDLLLAPGARAPRGKPPRAL